MDLHFSYDFLNKFSNKMSMNHYWEKYKNRNKSQDDSGTNVEKPISSNLILDQISSLQSQVNSLETKLLDLNCKFNGLNSFESHNFAVQNPVLEKIEKIEKSLEFRHEIDQRVMKLEDNNNFFRIESLRLDLVKELNLIENRISENFTREVQNINKKIKEIPIYGKENIKKVDAQPKEKGLSDESLKKIEKIVVACGERMKKLEENAVKDANSGLMLELEGVKTSINKFKNFQSKVVKKIEEIEEFSKKLCRKFIEYDSEGLLSSPSNKGLKKEQSLTLTQKKCKKLKNESHGRETRKNYLGYLSTAKMNSKKDKSTSPLPKENNKIRSKLEKLYEELNDF